MIVCAKDKEFQFCLSSKIPFLNPLGLGIKIVSLVTKAHLTRAKGREDMA